MRSSLTWRSDRAGLLEGLFLDREGYVDVSEWGARAAAPVIALAASVSQDLRELADKVDQASWAFRFANDVAARRRTVAALRGSLPVLPDSSSRSAWEKIIRRLYPSV